MANLTPKQQQLYDAICLAIGLKNAIIYHSINELSYKIPKCWIGCSTSALTEVYVSAVIKCNDLSQHFSTEQYNNIVALVERDLG